MQWLLLTCLTSKGKFLIYSRLCLILIAGWTSSEQQRRFKLQLFTCESVLRCRAMERENISLPDDFLIRRFIFNLGFVSVGTSALCPGLRLQTCWWGSAKAECFWWGIVPLSWETLCCVWGNWAQFCPWTHLTTRFLREDTKVSHYIINKIQQGDQTVFRIGDQSFPDLPDLLAFYKLHYLDTTPLRRPAQKKVERVIGKFDFDGSVSGFSGIYRLSWLIFMIFSRTLTIWLSRREKFCT